MDLRRRLARLDRTTRKNAVAPGVIIDPGDLAPALSALGLSAREVPEGTVWSRQDHRADVLLPAGPVPDVAGLLPAGTPADLEWSDVLFLDTETTGLAGGTGTLVFLVGVAWWQDGEFQVRQLLLSGPGREEPLLAEVARLARRFRVVATYNGASFDLPLLRTRARLARRDDPLADLVSWDLLTGARRCWGHRVPDCRQQTVEREVCRRQRGDGDISGALIPAVYRHFVTTGEPGEMAAVMRHNRRDMDGLGLVLSALASEATAADTVPPAGQLPVSWDLCWRRSLIGERRRDPVVAASWAGCTASGLTAATDAPEAAFCDTIRILKRVQAWGIVAELAAAGLARWPSHPRLHYEAAVVHEHRLPDLPRALRHAEALGDHHREARLRDRLVRDGLV